MKNKQLNRLLNTACEIITSLEHNADDDLMKTIDAMFNEIKYSDRIDDEMKVEEDDSPQDICDSFDADLEAQDFGTFGEDKI